MAGVSVAMVRHGLERLPQFALPEASTIRQYRPGDGAAWVRIHLAADQLNAFPPGKFEEQFGTDERPLAERQLYLCDGDGTEIGTATAWFNVCYRGQSFGRVHWVAIVPEWQGRGLAKPLLAAACNRLRELGHGRAYLTTNTARIAALNLYLSFGFVPDIREAAERAAWKQVRPWIRPAYWSPIAAVLEENPHARLAETT